MVSGDCQTLRSRGLQSGDADTCCNDCDFSARPDLIRIATWKNVAPILQAHLAAYQSTNEAASQIRLSVLPSLQELQQEVRHDLRTASNLYDAFVVTPSLMGDLLRDNGLATLDISKEDPEWLDLLPYYRDAVATIDDKVRGMPLSAGNQILLLYRKDYLASQDLPIPRTWGEYIRVAEALDSQNGGGRNRPTYGSCLGRMSEAACRSKMDREGGACNSLSMTYLEMTLAPITQTAGSATGWLFDDNVTEGMSPLLNPSLERLLVYMENQLKYGPPEELMSDASMNLDLFRQGECALTVAVDHPEDLLNDPNVGFVPIPGSHNVFDREAETMVDCTLELCSFGTTVEEWGVVNQAPVGAHDFMVGAVASSASQANSAVVQDFFSFVMKGQVDIEGVRQQPITYSGLGNSTVVGYREMITSLTESKNIATPIRVPNSFALLSELDNQVYQYLSAGNFSDASRQQVREDAEASLQRMILAHDVSSLSFPTADFYQQSLGIYAPNRDPDLYIGKLSRAIGWSMGGLSCLCSIFFALWVWRFRNERQIIASQTVFLYMICAGTFLMAGTIFSFGVEDDIASVRNVEMSCMASMWFYAFGYIILFSALFSKIWRINKVFRSARNMQRIKVENVDILVPFFVLLGINLPLLITWNSTDRVRWFRKPVSDPLLSLTPDDVPTYGFCDSENYRIYLGLMLGTNYILSLVALVQAYEIRKVTTDYGESLWISGALASTVQVWTIGLPLLKLLDDDPRSIFFVKAFVVFLTTMSCLLLIFVPKMRYLRQSWGSQDEVEQYGLSKDSVTSHDTDESNGVDQPTGPRASGLEPPSMKAWNQKTAASGLEGIRIIQVSSRHSEEVEQLEKHLHQAEKRHKALNERLERIQEKLEQYIVSSHPPGPENSNFILSARSELTSISGTGTSGR